MRWEVEEEDHLVQKVSVNNTVQVQVFTSPITWNTPELQAKRTSEFMKLMVKNLRSLSETSNIRHKNVCPPSVPMLRVPPLDFETGWTGELWLKTNVL